MDSRSLLVLALLFSVPILYLQGNYAYRIEGDADADADADAPAFASAPASASASGSGSGSGAIEGGFGNGNWDSQGYGDDEERTAAPKRRRCEWTKSLREKFIEAINYCGLENATPTIILGLMNKPDLTRSQVASHLQKYRKYVNDKKDADVAGDEEKREKLSRSSFALGHPELFNNNERGQPHSQHLKQQQMGTSIGSTFQPSDGIGSTLPLTAAACNSQGSIQFSNDQQPSTSYAIRSTINLPLIVENSNSYLMPDEQDNYQTPSQVHIKPEIYDFLSRMSVLNNNPANFLHQQPMLGNCNGDQLFCQENRRLAGFGMQQPSNNFENGGNVENSNRFLHMMPPPDEQDNYQPPSQQQDGGHDQLPYQVEVAAYQVPNPSADQVPNPGPYHVEYNAPNEILEPGMPTLFEPEDNSWFSYLSEHIPYADP